MRFAGKVWRLLVGIKDGLVLIFMLLFFWALFAVLTARPSPAQVREGALVLNLDGVVVEEAAVIDPIQALLSTSAPVNEYQVRDLVRALNAAATDDRVKAVVFDLDRFLGGGQVHLQAIGAAMDRVRAANKPVLTYATAYADDAMLLSAHASEVWVNPLGGAAIAGPGGEMMYYAGLLEKLGVNARVYRVGEFKSAVEPYSLTGMSEPARENLAALYGALWEEWQANVKKARPGVDLARVTSDPVGWVKAAGGDMASAAKAAGLVDRLGNRYKFEQRVVELVGQDEWNNAPNAYPATDLNAWLSANPAPQNGRPIGVITIAGEIVDGDAGPGTAGAERIVQLLDDALADDLAGLVIRVDSPGGSALASEDIRQAILRHKARGIPVAVAMANVAASGGYWVATPGQRIFAEPETITGSIGIFAVLPTFERTAERLGVTTDGVRTTPLSGQPDFIGGFTPEVDAIVQAGIDDGYQDFIRRVAFSRKMTLEQVDGVGQGRVWDGGTARQLKLVDEYGGIEDALTWVAKQAKIANGEWHPQYLGQELGSYDTLLSQLVAGDTQKTARGDVSALFARRHEVAMDRVLADFDRLTATRSMQVYCLECPQAPRATRYTPQADGWLARMAIFFTG